MMKSTFLSLPTILVAFYLAGCSSRTTTSADNAEAVALLERLRQSYASTPSLNIMGKMKVSGMPATVWFDALARARDSLKIGLTGPFSIPVGAMAATRESFLFYNAQEGTAYEGRPDRETFAKVMMIDLDYEQMVSMIRGELPRIPSDGEFHADMVAGNMRYTMTGGNARESFTIDPVNLAAIDFQRWRIEGEKEIVELSMRFSNYFRVGGRTVPRKGIVEMNNGDQTVTIDVDKVYDTIDSDRSMLVDLPPGTPRKRI